MLVALGGLGACQDATTRDEHLADAIGPEPDPPQSQPQQVPMDERPVTLAETPPLPVMGGTLHLTSDGAWLVATDPDRDQIHVVDLADRIESHVIATEAGAQPWRIAEDSTGTLHVVQRGTGSVVSFRPESEQLGVQTQVCAQPRGIAIDDVDDVWVACAGGELVTLRDGVPQQRQDIPVDARDLWFDGTRPTPWVSTFRDATVYDPDGASFGLPPLARNSFIQAEPEQLRSSVAWRTRALGDGGFVMVHQLASDRTLDASQPDDDGGHGHAEDGGTSGGPFGGGGDGYGDGEDPCGAIVTGAVTMGDANGDLRTTGPILGVFGAIDVAFDPTKTRVAIASASTFAEAEYQIALIPLSEIGDPDPDRCWDTQTPILVDRQPTALAFDDLGFLYVQVREPAAIYRVDVVYDELEEIPLSGPSRADTGHTLFHELGRALVACASCHPEGADDGHIWAFDPIGLRHTPALDVGLAGTEPFHWQGDLPTFGTLVDEVMVSRMGALGQSAERSAALERYVFALDAGPTRSHDAEIVARGAEAYGAFGCGSCHSAGVHVTTDLGFGVALQSPPLSGVGLHPPYMHDGRAATLRDAVVDMIDRTAPAGATVGETTVDDLVAYLETI